jgi:hypothetical protein
MSESVRLQAAEGSELRRFWPAVVACFATAVFSWGFGFSGTSVYLAELQRLHGWSSAPVASAITAYYLIGALCLARGARGTRVASPPPPARCQRRATWRRRHALQPQPAVRRGAARVDLAVAFWAQARAGNLMMTEVTNSTPRHA